MITYNKQLFVINKLNSHSINLCDLNEIFVGCKSIQSNNRQINNKNGCNIPYYIHSIVSIPLSLLLFNFIIQ